MIPVQKFFKMTTRAVRWICLVLLLGLALLVFAKVIFRYLLNSPLIWSDEIILLSLLALTYFGAALAAYERSHISVDLIEILIKRRGTAALKVFRLVSDIIIVSVLSFIIYYGVQISLYSRNQQTDILLLSYFWVYMIMPLGLVFILLLIARRIYEDWFALQPAEGYAAEGDRSERL